MALYQKFKKAVNLHRIIIFLGFFVFFISYYLNCNVTIETILFWGAVGFIVGLGVEKYKLS